MSKDKKLRIILQSIGVFIMLCGLVIIFINNFVKEIIPFKDTLILALIGSAFVFLGCDFRPSSRKEK